MGRNTRRAGRPSKGDDSPDLRREIGPRLERLRRWHHMSQESLAAALGVSTGMVARYESGRNLPRLEVLLRLRRVLSCTLEHLVLGQRIAEMTDIRLLARLRRIDTLPAEQKLGLYHIIDAYLDSYEPAALAPARSSDLD